MEKKQLHRIIKIIIFFISANLPFLTIANLLGIDTFIDSFQHPNYYHYIKNEKIQPVEAKGGYLIIEKPTSHGYSIKEGESILYYTAQGTAQQSIVYQIMCEKGIQTYYTMTSNENDIKGPIYEQQIIGRIKARFDDNLWNVFCLQIWEVSIDNLNAMALFSISWNP